MSFLLSFLSFFSVLTVRVEWINHRLDIPLEANIENYKELPEARLFIDDILTEDPLMFYERDGVDHTFFSVVTTSYVKSFTIRYRVHFPTYDLIHTEDIIFNIVDLIPPIIQQVPSFRIPLNQSMPNFTNGLIYYDNYDEIEDLQLNVNSLEVILDQVGTYTIFYQLSDTSGNVTIASTTLEVYDYLAPIITLKKPIIINYEDELRWQDFLTIQDNDDVFPDVYIDDSNVDYAHIGTYQILVTATDKNGLSTTLLLDLSIIDNQPPEIAVKSQPLPIPVFSSPSDIDFFSYIISVSDNYDQLSISDVIITYDIEFDMLGAYYIYFELEDFSGNRAEIKMKIYVVDQEKPVITMLSPLEFDVFSPEPFYIDYIEYVDNYTDYEQLIIKIIESVRMDIIGNYPLTIEVTDTSGNKTILRTYIHIIDRIKPEIEQLNDIIITDFSKKSLVYYFKATDNYDDLNELIITVDDGYVDYEKIGSYPITVYAYDLSSNMEYFDTELMIIDILEPELILKQSVITIEIYSVPINLTSYIIQASDNYDSLDIFDVLCQGEINYLVIGVYTIEFVLNDSSMNITRKSLYVTVDDLTPPSIESSLMILSVGDYFDPLLGIEVQDNLDDFEVQYFPQILDTSTPGKKTVSYVVTDKRGNYTTHIREVIVEPNQQEVSLIAYVPITLITIIGAGACYYFYKRLR
ncbi:MAG: hypothetical protein ABH890_00030 [Bacillota bacterium]